MKTVSTILILFSSTASIYYLFVGLLKPETLSVYNKATISHLDIQLLSLFLGIGGVLLLFPQTFKAGGLLLIIHSMITITCFAIIKDWKGAFFEFLFLPIPVFLIWGNYPLLVLEKLKKYLLE